MAEATARRRRQAASDKLNAVGDLVTALVNRNMAAAKRPSTITLERKLAAIDKEWFKVDATFYALRLHNSTDEHRTEDNDKKLIWLCTRMIKIKLRSC